MSERLKFRVWEFAEGKMWSHEEIDRSDTDGIVLWGDLFKPEKCKQHGFSPLMQFTGLLDSQGKEIFEGDRVEWLYSRWKKKRVGEVAWGKAGFWVVGELDRLWQNDTLTVIGNIYAP